MRIPITISSVAAWLVMTAASQGEGVEAASGGDELRVALERDVLPLLEERCMDCHDDDLKKGEVSFDFLYDPGPEGHDIRFWSKVREQVRTGTMPPAEKEPLAESQRTAILTWIEGNEAHVLASDPHQPGPPRTRRLNREEYNLTLRDLLGIEGRPGDKFPADGAGGEGFSNTGDTLLLSPLLIEKFLEAADEALDEVWQKPDLKARILGDAAAGDGNVEERVAGVLRPFLLRAYRRPASEEEDVRPLLGVFQAAMAQLGADWEQALRASLKAALVSPKFLFLDESEASPEPSGAPRHLGSYEMASHLSYFLWSSMPDDELLRLAADDRLRDDEELARQTRRMLADAKASAFVRSFAGQWFRFDEVMNSVEPDRRKFPDFNEDLRTAMYEEAIRFSDHILRSNGNVLDFLDSDYTFVNGALARLYEIPGIEGDEFQRVAFVDDRRGGLTGMAAVLASTAYPRRTSPVLRGKWILEQLLGTPPPPPPPNVGQLPEDDRAIEGQTLRARLEAHRDKPACAGCHVRLDPPGFALENFDPIGKWRSDENGKPLDASGELLGGRAFSSPAEFRRLLMEDKNLFVRSLCTRLLGYALGRGLEIHDQPTLLRLEQTLRDNGYRAEPLIVAVTQSPPFRYRQ